MPVKDKTEKEAYCDVCERDCCQTCAICGGVFCEKHSIVIEFRRENRVLRRRLCKKCLVEQKQNVPKLCYKCWQKKEQAHRGQRGKKPFKPIKCKGKPVSETIIEERR